MTRLLIVPVGVVLPEDLLELEAVALIRAEGQSLIWLLGCVKMLILLTTDLHATGHGTVLVKLVFSGNDMRARGRDARADSHCPAPYVYIVERREDIRVAVAIMVGRDSLAVGDARLLPDREGLVFDLLRRAYIARIIIGTGNLGQRVVIGKGCTLTRLIPMVLVHTMVVEFEEVRPHRLGAVMLGQLFEAGCLALHLASTILWLPLLVVQESATLDCGRLLDAGDLAQLSIRGILGAIDEIEALHRAQVVRETAL